MLCDYTRAAIQPQEVVGALQRMVETPVHRSRRVALYTEGRLATMQARRVASVRDDVRVFGARLADGVIQDGSTISIQGYPSLFVRLQ